MPYVMQQKYLHTTGLNELLCKRILIYTSDLISYIYTSAVLMGGECW